MSESKVACPNCGQHVLLDDTWAGRVLDCPSCQQPFTVPPLVAAVVPAAVPLDSPDGGVNEVPPLLMPPGSSGRRRGLGIGRIIALAVGMLVLLLAGFIGFRVYQFVHWTKNHEPGGVEFFRAASAKIGPKGVVASGNSEEAKALADLMSKVMLEMRNQSIEQAEKKAFVDAKDQFKTYCDLRGDQCVFLVHAPEMRRFTAEAQEALGDAGWEAAQIVLARKSAGRPDMKLAVAMMGLVSYERVMLGKYVGKPRVGDNGLVETGRGFGCERVLYDWFAPGQTNSSPPTVTPRG